MTWWLHSAAYPEIIEPMISASAPQAWMQYSIRLAGRNWLRSYRALGKGGRFIGYGVSAAIEGGRRNVVLVTANFTWLGLVGLVPRKSAHWYNITTEEKKHPEWFREDLSQLLAMLQEKSLAPWSRSSWLLGATTSMHGWSNLYQRKLEKKINS